jgi:hypothetical protein
MTQSLISFRPFREEDFSPLLAWFRAPHVARWWPVPESDAAVAATYLPRIRGEESVYMYAILLDAVPIGMAQICPVDQLHGTIPDACSLDLLIGDTSFINRGLGPRIIEAFRFASPIRTRIIKDRFGLLRRRALSCEDGFSRKVRPFYFLPATARNPAYDPQSKISANPARSRMGRAERSPSFRVAGMSEGSA